MDANAANPDCTYTNSRAIERARTKEVELKPKSSPLRVYSLAPEHGND